MYVLVIAAYTYQLVSNYISPPYQPSDLHAAILSENIDGLDDILKSGQLWISKEMIDDALLAKNVQVLDLVLSNASAAHRSMPSGSSSELFYHLLKFKNPWLDMGHFRCLCNHGHGPTISDLWKLTRKLEEAPNIFYLNESDTERECVTKYLDALLRSGVNPRCKNWLSEAIIEGDYDITRLLLDSNSYYELETGEGSPIMLAVLYGRVRIFKLLREFSAIISPVTSRTDIVLKSWDYVVGSKEKPFLELFLGNTDEKCNLAIIPLDIVRVIGLKMIQTWFKAVEDEESDRLSRKKIKTNSYRGPGNCWTSSSDRSCRPISRCRSKNKERSTRCCSSSSSSS